MIKKLIIVTTLAFAIISLHAPYVTAAEDRFIRVAILKDVSECSLVIKGEFTIYALYTGDELQRARRLPKTIVTPLSNGIKFGSEVFPLVGIKIIPEKDASIYVNKRRYRGEIDIIRQKSIKLLVINRLNVENYIKGVLYHEVDHKWPLEAIKAQAVATRTYAYYQMDFMKRQDYDVTSDIYSQVYGGKTSEKLRPTIAVRRTRHEVLTYNGKIFPAFFHATCAGHTEDASSLWDIDLPTLKGVRCDFCKKSPHCNWKRNLQLKDIQDKLLKHGLDIWLIKDIKIVRRNPSGRIIDLRITDRKGKSITMSGKDFRQIVGPNIIRSNDYEVIMKGYYVDFLGHGWGHGVGLCQWGANFMSRKGMSYRQILRFYYPQAEIVNVLKRF
ncbi:SpoIID/LytB domain-containing protein [Candidatus Omnitrophota bacterium]